MTDSEIHYKMFVKKLCDHDNNMVIYILFKQTKKHNLLHIHQMYLRDNIVYKYHYYFYFLF